MDTHHRATDQMRTHSTEHFGNDVTRSGGKDPGAAETTRVESPLHELDELLNNAVEQARSIC